MFTDCGGGEAAGSPASEAVTVSSTIPAECFKSYVSLVWANIQAAGAINMHTIEVYSAVPQGHLQIEGSSKGVVSKDVPCHWQVTVFLHAIQQFLL